MQRRNFLKTIVIATGVATVLPACAEDEHSTPHGDASDSSAASDTAKDGSGSAIPVDMTRFPQSVCSGDPREDGAIVWTRCPDPAGSAEVTGLVLQLSQQADFATAISMDGKPELTLSPKLAHDYCVKARLTNLATATIYYYRFVLRDAAGKALLSSPVGRFKTAPAASADVPVRFAVASCQDYNGRFYNSYARMTQDADLDFFVHLGDYVYETTGNPEFQDSAPDRVVSFSDKAGAIAFGPAEKPTYHAAQSLSNYRELYKTYRSDLDLQRVHELLAMVAIWDDHEFSDDCWGTHASYFDDEKPEDQPQRRAAADQAWFEYMPVDFPAGPEYTFDAAAKFPDSMRIYRDFGFGKHVHLILTDLRRYRPDHLVPEDAMPGAVACDEDQLKGALGQVPTFAIPYINATTWGGGKYAQALASSAAALKLDAAKLKGMISAPWLNAQLGELKKAGVKDLPDPVTAAELATLQRGIAFHQMLKVSQYSSIGTRYLVVRAPFEAYAKVKWKASGGASEDILGAQQGQWFKERLQSSQKTWKLWGSEFTFQSRIADLSAIASLPDAFRAEFLLSAEDWDGAPNKRQELLTLLAGVPNTAILSGDIHAFFAGTALGEKADGTVDDSKKVPEFVGGAISSGTYETLLFRQASADAFLNSVGAPALALLAADLLTGKVAGIKPRNANLGYAKLDAHGYLRVEADAKMLQVTMVQTPEETSSKRLEAAKVAAAFTEVKLRVAAGTRDLQMLVEGTWKTWDPKSFSWI